MAKVWVSAGASLHSLFKGAELSAELTVSGPRADGKFSFHVEHRLCGFLYELATTFTAFFEACPVLRAPDDATRESRLALCRLTAGVLARGLNLLGEALMAARSAIREGRTIP